MKNELPPFIVSTDLDGTLLDHYSYSWQAALPSIEQLKARHCPIIINTSKTFEEVKLLQAELDLESPFIVENGSAIYCPISCDYAHHFDDYNAQFTRKVLGSQQEVIVAKLHQLRDETHWKFEGYSDWETDNIVEHTGLSLEKAKLSQQRQFSEPILWHDSEKNYTQFERTVKLLGYRVIRGGRFIHILGPSDKGQALQGLQAILAIHFEDKGLECKAKQKLICLGDSYNDLDMLKISDYPVFVRSPVHGYPEHQIEQDAIFTRAFGPEGWHEAITHILKNN